MGRPATGSIVEPEGARKSFAIRFRVNGVRQHLTLGRPEDGWTKTKAEERLAEELAAVRLGVWEPPKAAPIIEAPSEGQTFHEFAEAWFEAGQHEWSTRTIADYKWALELHVLPFFGEMLLGEIAIETVDQFRTAKLKEGKLAPPQINKCIKRVSQILAVAEEYDLVVKNVARGKKRKAKEPAIQRTWVEPEQALILVEESTDAMRPIVAMLLGTGARNGEVCDMDEDSVNLATATAWVGKAKTDAGSYRELDLPAGVVEALTEWLMRSAPMRDRYEAEHPGERPLFLTEFAGVVRRQTPANVDRRMKTCIRRANKRLKKLKIEQISEKVTPHSLRRTYASLRAVVGDDLKYTSDQLGHKDIRFSMAVYAKATKRRAKLKGVYLREFDRALDWAKLPTATDDVWAQLGADVGESESGGVEEGVDLA